MTAAPAPDTKDRILDAAEQLFSRQGFAATSLRGIITLAGVNLAAIHYHFKTKEALIEAVVMRRVGPLNVERLRQLDEAVAQAAPHPAPLDAILSAFVEPTLAIAFDEKLGGRPFVELMGRLFTEGSDLLPPIFQKHGMDMFGRFAMEIRRTLPDRDPKDLFWDMFLAVGVMTQTLLNVNKLEALSRGQYTMNDSADLTRRVVEFAVAGITRK